MAIGMLAVLAVLVLIGLPVLALVVFLIHRKRWGVLLGGMAAMGCALLMLLFTVNIASTGYEAEQRVKRLAVERQRAEEQTRLVTLHSATPSDAELVAVAAAKPRIELDNAKSEEAEVEGAIEADEITIEPSDEPRPEWMTADLEENQQRFTAGPFTTVEQCRSDARTQLTNWVWDTTRTRQPDFGSDPPAAWSTALDEIAKRFRSEEHLEKRQTSVGEVYLLHTLATIDHDDSEWLESDVKSWVREGRRTTGIRAVTLIGGLAVGLLGWSHLLLRGGKRTSKEDA